MGEQGLRLVVTGAMGRMGQALVRAIDREKDLQLIGATERHDHPLIAKDVGTLLLGRHIDVPLENDLRNVIVSAQAILDFTMPESAVWHAQVAARYKLPLVLGTTGLSAEQHKAVRRAAEETRIVLAPNMSIGVNLLFHLARRAARAIGLDADIEIVETHHRHKADAPSGTALRLAEIVGAELGYDDPAEYYIHGRQGYTGVRPAGRIGLHAVRGGDVVGRHDLMFLAEGETLTLSHNANSRDCLVRGALRAAGWLQNQPAGLYDMGDVLGL